MYVAYAHAVAFPQLVLLRSTVIMRDANARTVYIYIVHTKACGIEAGLLDGSLGSKSLAEQVGASYGATLFMPAVTACTPDVEASILDRSTMEDVIRGLLEVFLQKSITTAGNTEIIEVSLLGLIAVRTRIVVLAEAEISVSEIARSGIHLRTINVGCGCLGILDLDAQGVYLAVLDIHTQRILRQDSCTPVFPPVWAETRRSRKGVYLPHIIVVMVFGSEDKACSQALNLELYLQLVVLDNSNRGAALRRTRTFYPFGLVPGRCGFKSDLEVSPFCAGRRISLVIGNRYLPVVTGSGLGRKACGLNICRLAALHNSRLPFNIIKITFCTDSDTVRGLHTPRSAELSCQLKEGMAMSMPMGLVYACVLRLLTSSAYMLKERVHKTKNGIILFIL